MQWILVNLLQNFTSSCYNVCTHIMRDLKFCCPFTVRQTPHHRWRGCSCKDSKMGGCKQWHWVCFSLFVLQIPLSDTAPLIFFNIRENRHKIGYWLHSAYHGKEYAKESYAVLFDYVCELGIKRPTAGTAINKHLLRYAPQILGLWVDRNGKDVVLQGCRRKRYCFWRRCVWVGTVSEEKDEQNITWQMRLLLRCLPYIHKRQLPWL